MHTHILINKDLRLHIIIISKEPEVDFIEILDEMIVAQLTYATEGIQKT